MSPHTVIHASVPERGACGVCAGLGRLDAIGALLEIAITDARTRSDLPATAREQDHMSWDMLVRLRDEEHRIAPAPQIRIERPGSCRHGVLYTDDCADCEADFG